VAAAAEPAYGCDLPPRLAIFPKDAYLDLTTSVDELSLGQALRARQAMYEELGAPKQDIWVDVAPGVSAKRLRPFLASARGAGFIRIAIIHLTQ
jgi:hypothetical protein